MDRDIKINGKLIGMVSMIEIVGRLWPVAYYCGSSNEFRCLGEFRDRIRAAAAIRKLYRQDQSRRAV